MGEGINERVNEERTGRTDEYMNFDGMCRGMDEEKHESILKLKSESVKE